MTTEYRPRLSVEIPEEYSTKLRKYLTHGMQKRIFQRMTGNLVRLLEKYGEGVVAACVLDNEIRLEDLMNVLLKPCKEASNDTEKNKPSR